MAENEGDLVAKATELRRLTRNWGIHARQDEVEVDLKQLLTKNISRPMKLLFQDPMLFLVTFYVCSAQVFRLSLPC